MALPAEKARYTFADCLTWDENELIEIPIRRSAV